MDVDASGETSSLGYNMIITRLHGFLGTGIGSKKPIETTNYKSMESLHFSSLLSASQPLSKGHPFFGFGDAFLLLWKLTPGGWNSWSLLVPVASGFRVHQ